MGQERSRKGKHFLLCIACCVSIFLWLCGCVHSVKQWQGEQDLREAKASDEARVIIRLPRKKP